MNKITSTLQSMAVGPVGVDADAAWLACNHPERPPDKDVMYHIIPDCHGCVVAMQANVLRLAASVPRGQDSPTSEH